MWLSFWLIIGCSTVVSCLLAYYLAPLGFSEKEYIPLEKRKSKKCQ